MLRESNKVAQILIAEDETIVAADINLCLQKLGYTVTATVSSGEAVLNAIEDVQPDLVLMDIELQGDMDGIRTAEIIRDRWHIPVVFISAFSDIERLERAKLVCPFGYILKPFDERDLRVTLEMALYVGRVDSQRRQAEQVLKDSEENLRQQTYLLQTLIDGIPDIVALQKPDFSIIMFNSSGYRLLGKSPSEVEGQKLEKLMKCESAGKNRTTRKVLSSRKIERKKEYYPHFNKWFHVHNIPVLDENGEIRLIVKVFRDITEQEQTIQALRESEEKFRNMYENSSMGIARVSLDDGILEANDAFGHMLGYSEKDLIGKSLSDIIRSGANENYSQKQVQLLGGEIGSYKMEIEFLHKDGHTVYGLLNALIIHDKKGKPVYFLINVIDITENKLSDEALRQSHQTLMTVLDSIDANIYVSNMDTYEILFMNRHMRNTFGEDTIGKICWQALQNETKPCPDCTNDQLIGRDGKASGLITWDGLNPITNRWYMNYDQAIKWIDGETVKIQVAMDITDIKQSVQERRKLESQLRQAQKMEAIGNLAGGIAHDFNNILGALVGYIELSLLDTPESDPNYDNLCQAFIASKRATDLVKQILTFSRQSEQNFSPIDIAPIVKEALKFLRSTLPATIEIKSEVRELDAAVLADPTQIYQVMINLCTNAAYAMRDKGGILSVTLSRPHPDDRTVKSNLRPKGYLELGISDTGVGMDAKTLERIFEPYFTTKQLGQGTGMGLAVVHGIVKSHGGSIKVFSEPDKGSSFYIYLPLIAKPSISRHSEAHQLPRGTEHILYVDDEAPLLTIGKQMLERLGYQVDVLADSQAALETIRQAHNEYDLIITDQTMPKMTGLEFARQVIQLKPELPIILCTGFSESISPEKVQEVGIKALLLKPLDLRELAVTIRNILDDQGLVSNASPLKSPPNHKKTFF